MPIPKSTRWYLDSHLQQAEFALKVASNFACLADTPALESIRAALGNVGEARTWVRDKLAIEGPELKPKQRSRSKTGIHRQRPDHGLKP